MTAPPHSTLLENIIRAALTAAAKGSVDAEAASELGKLAVEYNAAAAEYRKPMPAQLPVARVLPPKGRP